MTTNLTQFTRDLDRLLARRRCENSAYRIHV